MYFETAMIKVTIQWKQPVHTTLLVSVRCEIKVFEKCELGKVGLVVCELEYN